MAAPQNTFSIDKAISYGWNTFKKHPIVILYLLITFLLPYLLSFVLKFLITTIFQNNSPAGTVLEIIVSVAIGILSLIFSLGIIRILLNIFENKQLSIENLYQDYRQIVWYFLASLLTGLVMLISFVPAIILVLLGFFVFKDYWMLFLIPAVITYGVSIYVSLRLSQWQYVLVDKQTGSIDAIQKSWDITKGNTRKLLVLWIVEFFIVILGIIALIVGILVAVPVTYLMGIYVYKALMGEINTHSSKAESFATK